MLKLKTGLSRFVKTCVNSSQFNNQAIVVEAIEPGKTGRVRFQATSWSARCISGASLQPGQIVYVIGHYNIMLSVEATPVPIDANTLSVFCLGC